MKLSNKTVNYLSSLNRNMEWTSSENYLKKYFKNQQFPISKELINYQINYSGFDLTIRNEEKNTFQLYLFSNKQISDNEGLEYERVGDKTIFTCGDHRTSQNWFYITMEEEICTTFNGDSVNILYSAIEKKVDQYALRNEIYDWHQHPFFYKIIAQTELEQSMNGKFELIVEASDQYASWWRNENMVIANGTWLDRKDRFFHVYGENEKNHKLLIKELRQNGILALDVIKSIDIYVNKC